MVRAAWARLDLLLNTVCALDRTLWGGSQRRDCGTVAAPLELRGRGVDARRGDLDSCTPCRGELLAIDRRLQVTVENVCCRGLGRRGEQRAIYAILVVPLTAPFLQRQARECLLLRYETSTLS